MKDGFRTGSGAKMSPRVIIKTATGAPVFTLDAARLLSKHAHDEIERRRVSGAEIPAGGKSVVTLFVWDEMPVSYSSPPRILFEGQIIGASVGGAPLKARENWTGNEPKPPEVKDVSWRCGPGGLWALVLRYAQTRAAWYFPNQEALFTDEFVD